MKPPEPLSAAVEELDCIAMLPVYLPPQMEDEDDRYLLRGAVLALVDSAKRELDAARTLDVETDGLPQLITDILRKYGGTMKGRGDHNIFEALVRYRARLTAKDAEGKP